MLRFIKPRKTAPCNERYISSTQNSYYGIDQFVCFLNEEFLSPPVNTGTWGSTVVKALCYYSGGPGIESQWRRSPGFFSWIPTEPCALESTQPLRNWVPGIPLGVQAAGAWGWRPTTLVVPNVKKSGALTYPDPLGPSRRPVVGETFTSEYCLLLKSLCCKRDMCLPIAFRKIWSN